MSMLGHYASYPDLNVSDQSWPRVGLFERHNCSPNGVIHVGAWDCAEMGCYKRLFGDNVIWIEANKRNYLNVTLPALKGKNSVDGLDNPDWVCYNVPIFNEDNIEVDIVDSGDTSYINLNPMLNERQFTKKLDTLISEENIDMEKYDFLNIDTEGSEMKVLEGFDNNLNKINYLFTEVSVQKRQEYGCTVDEMVSYLSEKGFKLVEVSDSLQSLGWGDMFFVRENI